MSDAPKQCNDSRFQCFIEPKNRFYAFDICPGYWEFVIDDFESGNARSVTHVHNEILGGSDALSTWMKDELDKKYFFDCAGGTAVGSWTKTRSIAEPAAW